MIQVPTVLRHLFQYLEDSWLHVLSSTEHHLPFLLTLNTVVLIQSPSAHFYYLLDITIQETHIQSHAIYYRGRGLFSDLN